MEISFWQLALVGGLITWTTCTFLRAVATRTHQLREQVLEQLIAAKEAKVADEVVVVDSGEATVAAVLNVPDTAAKPAGRNGKTNGKNGQTNGKGHGKASTSVKRPGH